MMNTERQRLRNAFRLIRDRDENIHLKDRLISVSTQKTNYSKKSFVKKLSVMNAMLNRRFLTRNYKTRPDRIMFYSFLEKSPEKEALAPLKEVSVLAEIRSETASACARSILLFKKALLVNSPGSATLAPKLTAEDTSASTINGLP